MSASPILDDLVALDVRQLKAEFDQLQAIREWALDNLGLDYVAGDRVEICHPRPSQSTDGWKCYAEALAVGQTGIAGEISFNSHAKAWCVLIGMDRTWSTHEQGSWREQTVVRYWNGPLAEMPEGHLPTYDLDKYPEGKTKHFFMRVDWVRKAQQ